MRDGGKFESGKDSPSDAAGLFVYQMKISQTRTKHIQERSRIYSDALNEFLETFIPADHKRPGVSDG